MKTDASPLWIGPCAYATRDRDGEFAVIVYSSNNVTHVLAGNVNDATRAEILTNRLNRFPRQSRQFHGLL